MEQKLRKRAPGAGRKPKQEAERYARRTVTLPPAIVVAVERELHAGETFSAALARLLASHPAIARKPQQNRAEQHKAPPATVELEKWRMYSRDVIDSAGKAEEYYMEAPDGWQTKRYRTEDRAKAEARRRVLSQPKIIISDVGNG